MTSATVAQRKYLKHLIETCRQRGIELPNELLEQADDRDLTVRQASELIDAVRMELGWKEH